MIETPRPPLTAMKIFLRGLAISLPAILTLVILIWITSLINSYIIQPTNSLVTFVVAQFIDDSRPLDGLVVLSEGPLMPYCGRNYRVEPQQKEVFSDQLRQERQTGNSGISDEQKMQWIALDEVYVPINELAIPYIDYEQVARRVPESQLPRTVTGIYMELAVTRHFTSLFHLSALAVVVIIAVIYVIGRVVTIRLGAWFVRKFETLIISSLPVVRNVYGSVKQITDFLFSENQIEVRRVIAFEYPRKGIWSLGFVTGDSMVEISADAGEPCISVLVPTSPMPMTGYTMNVARSEVIDLDITVEQAFQYIVSCGVLVPPHQKFQAEKFQQILLAQQAKTNSQATS